MRDKRDLFEAQDVYAVVESIAEMDCEDYGESMGLISWTGT
jgi:hypothetical protein